LAISSPTSQSRQKSRAPDKRIVNLGYPAIFHWAVLVILVGLLIFSAFKHMVPLLASTVFLLVLAILPRFWSRYALRCVSGRVASSPDRVFPGEEVEITLVVVNKGLPLPWLEIVIELPHRLVTGKRSLSPYIWERLRWVTTLSGGQAITWKHRIEARARGDYRLGPLRLRSGDAFGLFPRELVLPQFQSLLVYPRILPLSKLSLPMKALLGEKAAPKSIYEDISRVAGARDYRYGDPFKHIHWKASAAHGKLQTRQYESSTSLSLLLIFDVHGFTDEDEEFEQAVSAVASLAYEAERQGFAVGLVTNGEPEAQIAIASGRGHLMQILEALARVTTKSRVSLYQQVDKLRTITPMGATLVLVSRTRTPALSSLACQLERDGHSLLCITSEQGSVAGKPAVASLNKGACS